MMNNEKILYTKYSNDRAASFRIATQIIERDGKKIVRKSAMEEASRSHIVAMKKHEIALSGMFVGTKFKTNKIIDFGNDFVDFEYLEGTSYDQILDAYLKNKDMDGFYSAVKIFFEELDKLATTEFYKNEKTIEVFGNDSFVEGEKAVPVCDIDQIFQNVIVDSDGNWNVIDYEWTFDFAVPVKYLKWRSLMNTNAIREQEFKICSYFHISKEDADKYLSLEILGFQRWLGSANFLNHSQMIRKAVLDPYVIERNDRIEVYYDTGKGFSEAEKDIYFQFPIAFFPKENLRSVRVDPSARYCIASDICIKAGKKELGFTTNAYMQKDGSYFFNTADPQVYFESPKDGFNYFYVNMLTSPINENSALVIERQKSKIQEQGSAIKEQQAIINGCIADLQASIQQADYAIQQKQKEIDSIYASRSWKLTKPLRACGKLVGKILRKV